MTDTTNPTSAAAALSGTPAPAADPALDPNAAAAPAAAAPAGDPPADPAATEAKPDDAAALKLPGKDATPEDWAAFYKSIGAPETAEAYELPVPEGEDTGFAKTAAEWFKDAGLLPQQAQALAGKWNEFVTAQKTAAQTAEVERIKALDSRNKAEEASLKNEWGGEHEANMELARRAVRQFLPGDKAADVITAIEDKLGYAATMKFMHSLGKGLGEHDAPGLGQNNQAGRKSAAEILYGATAAKSA